MFFGDCFTYSYPIAEDGTKCAYDVTSEAGTVYYYYPGVYNMANVKFERVNALPVTLAPSTVYLVKSSYNSLVEMYVTNNDGTEARHIINKDEINTMVQTAVAGSTAVQLVTDITARNALTLPGNGLVIVKDATGDATVGSGAALYFYEKDRVLTAGQTNADRYTKIAEYEGMDVTLTWDMIQGKPTSSVAEIDSAVAQRHTHANKVQLDLIAQRADGEMTYNGQLVVSRAVELVNNEW
jgi:hypothetical protein